MTDYKIILGTIAVGIEILSYLIYLLGIYRGQTKPHGFTFFVWGTINAVAFAAVLVAGGETGAWVLAVNAIFCYLIAGIGFWQKRVEYDRHDWIALVGALVGILLWWVTKNPLTAVILVVISDGIGSVPIFRKAYKFPFEENALAFGIGMLYYPLSILALESLIFTTWFYSAFVIVLDLALVILILTRRKQLAK